MRNIATYIATLMVGALFAVGCSSVESNSELPSGELRITNFGVDGSFEIVGDDSGDSGTAAQESQLQSRTEGKLHYFAVTITNLATGVVEQRYPNHVDIPSTILLKEGQYKIVATTADIYFQLPVDGAKVVFETPRFYAEKEVVIVGDEITSIDLTAELISASVKVDFSDSFEALYPCEQEGESYRVEVYSTTSEDVTFVRGETRCADFLVDSDNLELSYSIFVTSVNSDGELETIQGAVHPFPAEFMPVRAATHYNLLIKVLGV